MGRLFTWLVRIGLALFALILVGFGTRRYWLPERYAINVPLASVVGPAPVASADEVIAALRLPRDFTLTRFASDLNNARLLRLTRRGDVVVSQPREGRVSLLLADANGDGVTDGSSVLVNGLDRPHGLALRDGYLYVAEMTAVGRIRFDESSRAVSGSFERVIEGLPRGGNHWTRTIGFGPDGFLYLTVGSSCNVCIEDDPRRAAISRYDPSTWRGSVFASGLRNSVGFAWRTVGEGAAATHELMATDNGRDLLGNDFPPCELNQVVEGGFYGWPFANGTKIADPDLGAGHDREIAASLPPVHSFAAHNAPLGIAFLESSSTPEGYRGAALVALHGSWNRTTKDGYKVVSLHWDASGGITQRDFLTGFLENETVIGRPVDIAQAADGSIYISDDLGGSVFKVTAGERSVAARAPNANVATTPPVGAAAPHSSADDAAASERGSVVWNANRCETCHDKAAIAAGRTPVTTAKVLERLSARYDVPKLVTYLKAPQPPMPLFEMTEQERRDLAAYLLKRFP
jgi:glucose/arabinose dehydrogenase